MVKDNLLLFDVLIQGIQACSHAYGRCGRDDCARYLQERRVIEYVALGDYATAVGFLLASTPEKSARYYRDALCTLALAVCTPTPPPHPFPFPRLCFLSPSGSMQAVTLYLICINLRCLKDHTWLPVPDHNNLNFKHMMQHTVLMHIHFSVAGTQNQ